MSAVGYLIAMLGLFLFGLLIKEELKGKKK